MNKDKEYMKLSYSAQSVLKTLCSNYREKTDVKASFRCSIYYGLSKFIKDIKKSLIELEKFGFVSSYRIGDEETDEETDMCYFNTYATLSISVEDMAEISVNSQTIFSAD